ncbi:MAG TPA: type II secretion system protein [Candidatus Saccharimonadales bacterium]
MGGLPTTGRCLPLWRAARASVRDRSRGFTIVEVMIVLAVTGALFVAAAILINGKQNQEGFNQAVQQIRSQVEQAMNEVASGYFPANAGFQCTSVAGGPVTLTSGGAIGQGSNAGCIFAGKVLQFQVSGTTPEQYAVFTVAGAQKESSGNEATSLANAAPKVVAPALGSPVGFPDITTTNILQNGLATTPAMPSGHPRMWYNNGGADISVGAVAFVPSFPQYTSNSLNSGSQQISIYPVTGTMLGATKQVTATAINANLASSVQNPSAGVSVCFASGGTNESGLLTIGGGSHPLSVTMKVMDGTTTCGK